MHSSLAKQKSPYMLYISLRLSTNNSTCSAKKRCCVFLGMLRSSFLLSFTTRRLHCMAGAVGKAHHTSVSMCMSLCIWSMASAAWQANQNVHPGVEHSECCMGGKSSVCMMRVCVQSKASGGWVAWRLYRPRMTPPSSASWTPAATSWP